jgi:hypothetical protein
MRWYSIMARIGERHVLYNKMATEWNWWFAWHPVRANRTVMWLEWVQRKSKYYDEYSSCHRWEYRPAEYGKERSRE